MHVHIASNATAAGEAAAQQAAQILRLTLASQGEARIILATGASQFDMLADLVQAEDINWPAVTAFHLDEYIGLPAVHPASFRKYLQERFASRVPLAVFHSIQGDAPDPQAECERVGGLIREAPIDLALVGIGENGHLAFNDPPADFVTEAAYLVVDLDEICRMQQVGEGWFASLETVPRQAISMSIRQIMLSRCVVCTVPDLRKAQAVRGSLESPVTPDCPASILQQHENCHIFLDEAAASLLRR